MRLQKVAGSALLLFAVGLVIVLGSISLTMHSFSILQNRSQLERLNRMEGFLASEMVVWHRYYREQKKLTPPNPANKNGTYNIDFESQYNGGLSGNESQNTYSTDGYVVGTPLPLSITTEFDSEKWILRRYTGDNLSYDQAQIGRFCGGINFGSSKRRHKLCLSTASGQGPCVGSGKVFVDFGSDKSITNDHARTVLIRSDGKYVLIGRAIGMSGNMGGSVRIHPDLQLDSDFGTDGKVRTPYEFSNAVIQKIGSEERILTIDGTGLERYHEHGGLDISFGESGRSKIEGFSYQALLMLQNGKILVGGNDSMARLDSEGRLDRFFGNDGLVRLAFPERNIIDSLIELSDGKLIALGRFPMTGLVRINPSGSLDTTFGNEGRMAVDSLAYLLFLQKLNGSERFLTLGGDGDFLLNRYHSDGQLDISFGNGGVVRTDLGGNDQASKVAFQSDGKFIVAGSSSPDESIQLFALARYHANGNLDLSFGQEGKVLTDTANHRGGFHDVKILPDGRIVAVGQGINNGWDFALIVYCSDGSLP